ncbi:MAG TPA: hypothetical protein VL359_08645, partial [bacterium]|nr:hypothetical protein [bacterium]
GWAWCGMLALAVALCACGYRDAPVPQGRLVPPTSGVRAHFREQSLLVSWDVPSDDLTRRYGPVMSYTIVLREIPLACAVCPPVDTRTLNLASDSRNLIGEGGRLYLPLTPPEPVNWLVSVRTRYLSVENADSDPVLAQGQGTLPQATLRGERVPAGRSARLFWAARRERQVQVLTAGGGMEVRDYFFRANLYRRVPPAAWPIAPLNPEPLTTLQETVPLPPAAGSQEQVEYAMRWVDEFDNEGPLSAPVRISLSR